MLLATFLKQNFMTMQILDLKPGQTIEYLKHKIWTELSYPYRKNVISDIYGEHSESYNAVSP